MKLPWFAKLIAFACLIVTPLAAGALQTSQPNPRHYRLHISLFDGHRLVGQPRITVADARPAIVTVEREGGYSIRLVATQPAEQSQSGRVRLAAEVFYVDGGKWRQVAAPRLTLAVGTTATVESQPRGTASRAFKMEVLATHASPSNVSAQNRPCTKALQTAWRSSMAEPIGAAVFRTAYAAQEGLKCCDTGCLKCCGGSGTCCEDAHNCVGGCCVD